MSQYKTLFDLGGRTAMVTGGARGIGFAIADALSELGADVLITDTEQEAGRHAAESLAGRGGRVAFHPHDVTDEAAWERACQAMQAQFGGFDILVNNAGIETASLFAQCEVEDFERVMRINVTGSFLGIKHAMRVMTGGSGAIVNLSSVAGIIGTPAHGAYHSSKGAVRSMTKAAAVESAALGLGIRVNSVHPAIVRTDMGDAFLSDFVRLGLAESEEAARTQFEAVHPMGFGAVEDVACAVAYLASDAAKWVNGAELVVDGGFTAQ